MIKTHGTKLYGRWGWGCSFKRITFRYRFDPVPGTGKQGRLYPNIYRKPKTTQERRMSFADPEYVRGKRTSRNIPNCWDDYYRTNWDVRSWKKNKVRKQWMKNI